MTTRSAARTGFAVLVCMALGFGAAGQQSAGPAKPGCDLPKLFVLPRKDQIAGTEEAVRAAAKAYFTGIAAYSACLQAEILAAGGDAAPDLLRSVLVLRNNAAVDEANYMMKQFTEIFGTVPVAAASPAGN
jgi:hypothetical protein